jgi:hypothetical protein
MRQQPLPTSPTGKDGNGYGITAAAFFQDASPGNTLQEILGNDI